MKKIILFSATALSLLLPAASIAADLGRPAPVYKAPPPPAPVYSWTGCYVGAGGGYGMWNQENSDLGPGEITAVQTDGGRGWFGTAQVGCDYQLSSDWVIGAFGDWDFGSLSGHPHFPTDLFGNEKEKWAWAVGGRLGYVVVPNLLAYVSVGWREAHFNGFELFDEVTPFTDEDLHFNAHTYSGWFIGTGYEYGLKWFPGLFWKTEYRYAEFSAVNIPQITTSTGEFGDLFHIRKFEQTIRSELVWRFNWGGPVRAPY